MSTAPTKQSVYIVRYGLTKFPLVESLGPFDSPIDPTEGIEHAKCIAKSIAADSNPPTVVFSSPFVRCAHTAQLISLEVLQKPTICIEEGLTEWLIPSLLVEPNGTKTLPRSVPELAVMYGTIDDSYVSLNPVARDDADDVPDGAPQFPETEEALLKRCATTLSRILDKCGTESIAIVSHAPCDQAMAVFLEGCTNKVSESQLGPWALGGITKFSRTIPGDSGGSFGEWVLDKYGETEHMPGKYKPGIKKWSLPCLDKQ